MGVWVHGCMGAWVYGYMGVWVYGCMDAWVYGWVYMVAWARGFMGVHGWRGCMGVRLWLDVLEPCTPHPQTSHTNTRVVPLPEAK